MRIAYRYDFLNAEEYLLAEQKKEYGEVVQIIKDIDASKYKTKGREEIEINGKSLYSPADLNKAFRQAFGKKDWTERRYEYYVSTNGEYIDELIGIPLEQQKKYLIKKGVKEPIQSYTHTDFVKNQVAVEVEFGEYSIAAYDLFVKHLLFYTGGGINVGIEILPMKEMQKEMSSDTAYYQGEVYNIIRREGEVHHVEQLARINPPIPLVIIGIIS